MIGRLVAVAGEPVNEKEAPQLVVFEEEHPWSPVLVPRVDARNVTEHYATCDGMPEVDQSNSFCSTTNLRQPGGSKLDEGGHPKPTTTILQGSKRQYVQE
jgi:hypothetical protein